MTTSHHINLFYILRGGPFDTWGGYGFSFRPYQKQTFFSAVKLKTIFSPFISFDSPHTMLSSQGVTTFTWIFHHVFLIRKLLCGICRTELLKLLNNYKLEGERSERKIFITIFPHYNLLIKHFFSIISQANYFFPQVAEQTIYFSKFAEQYFFHTKTIAPPGIKWSAPNHNIENVNIPYIPSQ